jgi:integrase
MQQKLMRHSNVATTMNVYGNATRKAKHEANPRVVQIVMANEKPQTGDKSAAA